MGIQQLIDILNSAKNKGATNVNSCISGLQVSRVIDGPGRNIVSKQFKIKINRRSL